MMPLGRVVVDRSDTGRLVTSTVCDGGDIYGLMPLSRCAGSRWRGIWSVHISPAAACIPGSEMFRSRGETKHLVCMLCSVFLIPNSIQICIPKCVLWIFRSLGGLPYVHFARPQKVVKAPREMHFWSPTCKLEVGDEPLSVQSASLGCLTLAYLPKAG